MVFLMLRVFPLLVGFLIFLYHVYEDTSRYDYFISGAQHLDITKMNQELHHAKDPKTVENWINNLPWTNHLVLMRQDFNNVFIEVSEHRPRAIWRFGGVISEEGILFFPNASDIPKDLPIIDAPVSQLDQSTWFLNELEEDLKRAQLWPVRVYQQRSADWVIELPDHRSFIFGTNDLDNRVKVCKKILPKLTLSNKRWGRVDFRYPKAFAISKNPL